MQENKINRWAILFLSFATLIILGCEQDLPNQAITSSEDLSVSSLDKHSSNSIMPIALARADNPRDFVPDFLGETVTIQGVITSPNFTPPATFHFVQDNSAGIQFYAPPAISLPNLGMGDKVVVTGVIKQFNGSTKIVLESASDLKIVGKRKLKKAKKIHAAHLADQIGERIEGQLVVLKKVRIVDGQFDEPGLVKIVDSKGDAANVFIDRDTDIFGSATPNGLFNLTGVVTQFTSDIPADNRYEIQPRGLFDID